MEKKRLSLLISDTSKMNEKRKHDNDAVDDDDDDTMPSILRRSE